MPNLRPGERFNRTLYGRLLIGEALVVLVLLATVAVVAAAVGPSLFHLYLVENGPLEDPADLVQAERAFRSSLTISMIVALLVASVVAIIVGLVLIRPVRRRLRELAVVAGQVAAGDYTSRVDPGDAGEEITLLAGSFNAMATRLGEAEAARRRLLADLAHELRTPIASLSVTVEAVADGVLEPNPATLDTLTEQAGRLTRLAADLRDISDAQGGLAVHPVRCEVADLLEQARAAAAEDFAREGVDLVIDGSPAGTVRADAQRIGQVLANLLSNALRHSPSGGVVTLAARPSPAGAAHELSVADSGDGIAPEHLPHVFERFYRTDAARARDAGGTGIGLAVSAAIAEAHGGRLEAASPGLGEGAVFTLSLPSADGS